MKFLQLIIGCTAFLFSEAITAQKVVHITPEQLFQNIQKTEGKATIIQFWIPNCENAPEIVDSYKKLEDKYSSDVDFYFIGITNKDSLVNSLLTKTRYSHDIYIADVSVHNDIYERKLSFCNKLCKILNIKEEEFITLYIDSHDKVRYIGNAIEVKENKIQRIIRK